MALTETQTSACLIAYEAVAAPSVAARVARMPAERQERLFRSLLNEAGERHVTVDQLLRDKLHADALRNPSARFGDGFVDYAGGLITETSAASAESPAATVVPPRLPSVSSVEARRAFADRVFAHMDGPSPGSVGAQGLAHALQRGIDWHDDPAAAGHNTGSG